MKQRNDLLREAASRVLQRSAKQCNVVEWREDTKLVFKRYGCLSGSVVSPVVRTCIAVAYFARFNARTASAGGACDRVVHWSIR